MGKNKKEVLERIQAVSALPEGAGPDLLEWRADRFSGDRAGLLREIREKTGLPLIFTLRLKTEGGFYEGDEKAREEAFLKALETDLIQYADIEQAGAGELKKSVMAEAAARGVKIIMSSHNFEDTPSESEILRALRDMGEEGADIVKYAAMPRAAADVLALLSATAAYAASPDARPAITISMGRLGIMSRVNGGLFGSAATFASIMGEVSAPGQIPIADLRRAMDMIYNQRGD
jgi:3-dehydroquinate dehydratase-1